MIDMAYNPINSQEQLLAFIKKIGQNYKISFVE